MRIRRWLALAGALPISTSCGNEPAPWVSPVAFDTTTAVVRTGGSADPLLVEVARTPEQRSFGLSLRPELDRESGMVFLYDSVQPPNAGYWMWRTRVPLDIAFMDSTGTIVRVLQMEPCTAVYLQGCPTYEPDVPYWSALEVNRSWLEEKGAGEGSVVTVREPPAG